jgi:[ribosomal protein S18]-alanine N-acetyltransferase
MAASRLPNIGVRTVGPFDLGRLSRLHKTCFEESWSRADLAHLLAMPGGFGLIARLFEGGFVGLDGLRGVAFALCRVTNDESELLSIGVAPAHRGKGVATVLLRTALERCQRVGAKSMFLEVATDNVPAQRLYEQHGFARVGLRPNYYQRADGCRINAFTMRCDLAPSAALAIRSEPVVAQRMAS